MLDKLNIFSLYGVQMHTFHTTLGGMAFGFLFKSESISYIEAFRYIGFVVIVVAAILFITNFRSSPAVEGEVSPVVLLHE